ncbi:GIY-YIG nuclease family protein [Rhodovarius sp.]|uniref:GIY-YIG nuclease family protein n=1 Tax=Rhodovarius sp. TaxID=2972673 RepID=UPI003340070C
MSFAPGHPLLNPERLFSRAEALSRPCPIPAKRGVYAWYFSSIPDGVPTDGCLSVNGHTLLYVGISPKNESSSQNLRKRITYHYRGNAEGSTLRLTLGVLLPHTGRQRAPWLWPLSVSQLMRRVELLLPGSP